MKIFLLALSLSFSLCALEVEVTAPSAILMDAETGEVLFEKDAHAVRYPASITKILTGLMVLEAKGDALDEVAVASRDCVVAISGEEKAKREYKVSPHWLEFDATHMGIKAGEELTLAVLLDGMMLSSGCDASNVLAQHVAGDLDTFALWMNVRAEQLGCKVSHFTNAHGLHHPNHVSSAYDMALIGRAAMQHPQFREIVRQSSYDRPKTNKQEAVTLYQGNRLIRKSNHHYPMATGVKTGYHSHAGATLVASADNGERSLIAVVMGCSPFANAYSDVRALFDAAFAEKSVEWRLLDAGLQAYIFEVEGKSVETYTLEETIVPFYVSQVPDLDYKVEWFALDLPIEEDEQVGEVSIRTASGCEVCRVPLHAARSVRKGRPAVLFSLLGGGALILLWLRKRR